MSKYIGDFAGNSTFDYGFSTVNLSQVPTTLAGSPVIKIFKDNATGSEVTTGITLSVDFDTRTGNNNLRVVLTDSFYATGSNYKAIITAGTVDSISVVGAVICNFSIENRYMRGTNSASTHTAAAVWAVATRSLTTIAAGTLSAAALLEIANGIFDAADGVEPGSAGTERTFREAMRIILAAAAGKLSGAATSAVSIRDTNDTKNRIVATVDADGNRSAITLIDT